MVTRIGEGIKLLSSPSSPQQIERLLDRFSIEITGKDGPSLEDAALLLPARTSVNVTYLRNEDSSTRVRATELALRLGHRPVPHLSARRLRSLSEFEAVLSALREVGASEELFLVGGDPDVPEGPFEDALSLIGTGLLPEYGVSRVGITGYPEGHPDISDEDLWSAMMAKVSALKEQSIEASIITQFGFDAERVAAWITDVRERGIDIPIRVGVAGPAGAKRLLGYARRFGVQSSAGIIQKYGLSIANLMRTVGPDAFVDDLADRVAAGGLGAVNLHFYTFGGVRATAEWVDKKLARARMQGER